MNGQINNATASRLAEKILAVVMQSFAEYSFVHTPEQLQELITNPDTDPIFLQDVKEDILELINYK